MTTLARRLTVMAALVALASVLVTGLTTLGLYRQGATTAARVALGRDADTVAATLGPNYAQLRAARQQLRTGRVNRLLAKRQIDFLVVGPEQAGTVPPPFTAADVTAALAGAVSAVEPAGGRNWLVEGRALGSVAVLLAQPEDYAVAQGGPPRAPLLVALLFGLLGGGLTGWLMARQLGRPLSGLAATARRLSAGERDVRVLAEGPAEVADVGRALNDLAAALGASEARQRRFLTDVSHELRTPLTAVAGYAEGLADGVIAGDQVAPAGQVIQAEAARLSRRVDDLLALARTEADDFRVELAPADLAVLIRAAARAWQPRAAAAQVTLEVAVPDGVVPAFTDAERLRQAVDALADNALRVLRPGDRLVLACGSDGSSAWVSVTDNGPGLAPEDLAVAFERGRLTERYRGDRPVGSGLGLALVGELARRLNGTAHATPTNPAGHGAATPVHPTPATPTGVTFTLTIPSQPLNLP